MWLQPVTRCTAREYVVTASARITRAQHIPLGIQHQEPQRVCGRACPDHLRVQLLDGVEGGCCRWVFLNRVCSVAVSRPHGCTTR